jgi:hypothetical protein
MHNSTSTLRNALFAILLLTLFAVGMMASVPTLDAASNCTYYSDSTYTTVVGQYGYDCCNNKIAWGVKTQFSRCSSACFVCVPPPPGK